MNVHEFQCWHRSLLFLDRIGFETAALEVSFFFSKWIFQHTGSTPSRFGPLRRSISKFPIEPSSSSVYNTWWLFQSTKKGNWSLSSLEFNELYFIISKCSLPPGRYWRHVAFGGLLSSRPVKILFLTSELANKAEIYVLSARDTTRAWVPGRSNIGNDVRVYKTRHNTWLSSRLQNQPRSVACLIFSFTVRYVGHQRRSVRLN